MQNYWLYVGALVVAALFGIYGMARAVPILTEMLYIKALERRARRHLPLKIGMYIYVPDTANVVWEMVSDLEQFGINVLPVHKEAACVLLREYHWYNNLALSSTGEQLDLVVVGDLRTWRPMHGGEVFYRFRLRACNPKGQELLTENIYASDIPVRTGAMQELVRFGYRRILEAVLTLQWHKNTNPRWTYDTSDWPYSSDAFCITE